MSRTTPKIVRFGDSKGLGVMILSWLGLAQTLVTQHHVGDAIRPMLLMARISKGSTFQSRRGPLLHADPPQVNSSRDAVHHYSEASPKAKSKFMA